MLEEGVGSAFSGFEDTDGAKGGTEEISVAFLFSCSKMVAAAGEGGASSGFCGSPKKNAMTRSANIRSPPIIFG